MRRCLGLAVLALRLVHPGSLWAQAPTDGSVAVVVTDQSTHAPLEGVNVILG